jgi:hypothetical protein
MNNEYLLQFFNDYYISSRKKFLIQQSSGEYITVNRSLNDTVIRKHLNHELTVGLFAGKELTKFICFDVDSKLNSEKNVRELALILEEYGISRDNMLITFSGSKGFHLEIFFTKVLPVKLLKNFYFKIINELAIDKTDIEFRPSFNQGVKFPFGINFKSGLYCYPLSPYTFKEITKDDAIKVKKIDSDLFIDILLEIEIDLIDVFSSDIVPYSSEMAPTIDFNSAVNESIKKDVIDVLTHGKLLKSGTRNYITFNLALYLKSNGKTKEEIQNEIFRILKNTYEENNSFFSENTDLKYMYKEIIRIVNFIFKKNYFLKNNRVEKIELKTYEINDILKLKKEYQKLALILLYHSKAVSASYNVFYMSYNSMSDLGASSNRSNLFKMIEKLKEINFIEVVERGKINILSLNEDRVFKYLPNKYKMIEKEKIKGLRDKKISLSEKDILENDIDEILIKLFTKNYLKENVSKKVFYERFNKLYN